MKKAKLLLAAVIFIETQYLYADRGLIPFKPRARVFEPNQRAMIAWSGKEEILLLTTDLRASEPTKILEVLPLPSEPNVTKGDIEVFKKATRLINEKLDYMISRKMTLGPKSRTAGPKPAGEVTFHEKIGSHDISVTHVSDRKGFVEWVEGYLRSADVKNPKIPEEMKKVVHEYLKEGFSWFVFDVVELDKKLKTNDAIQYKFKTDYLYYPLKITSSGEGSTSIDLLILTPKLLSEFTGFPLKKVILQHPPIFVTNNELRKLNKDMYDLLSNFTKTRLRIWQIRGKLSEFKKDLIVKG